MPSSDDITGSSRSYGGSSDRRTASLIMEAMLSTSRRMKKGRAAGLSPQSVSSSWTCWVEAGPSPPPAARR